jgi:heptosyltransferase II
MKILVISLAGIGDTLLATPLIHELRVNFPDATIDALVLWAGSRDLLEHNPHVNRVFQHNFIKDGKLESLRFLQMVRSEHYDVSINTHPQSRMQYRAIAWFIGAPARISHEYECSGLLDRFLVNRTLAQDYTRHTIENNLALLPFVNASPKLPSHEMEMFLTPAEEQWAATFLTEHQLNGRKVLGVHVGSGGTKNLPLKRWPLAQYVELICRLNRELPDVSVLLFGGPEEARDHEVVLGKADRKLVLQAATRNLRQTAALLRHCDAFLSVDTALMHLAAAMKTSGQVVIEAPTLNPTNLPHGNPFTLVKNPTVAGRNLDYYRYDGGDIKGTDGELRRCMASVTVDVVFTAVNAAINS